jgi:hypothetical protein
MDAPLYEAFGGLSGGLTNAILSAIFSAIPYERLMQSLVQSLSAIPWCDPSADVTYGPEAHKISEIFGLASWVIRRASYF